MAFGDSLRQLAKLKLGVLRLGFLRLGSRVVELRLRGGLLVDLRILRLVLKVVTRHREGIHRQNKIVRSRLTGGRLQTSGERVTSLGIRRNIQRTARNLGGGISLSGLAGLNDLAVLVDPLDVVVQVVRNRQAGSVGLDLVANRCPVVSGVLLHHVELQSLRNKRNVPARVAIGGVTNEGTVATEELSVSASIQVSTEARARPLAKRPRVQRTDVIRQRVAVLVKDTDVAPVHVDML